MKDDFLDWDDARLGRLSKEILIQLRNGGNQNGKLFAVQAAMMIISYMINNDAATLKLFIDGFNEQDIDAKTDWYVVIKKRRSIIDNIKQFFQRGGSDETS